MLWVLRSALTIGPERNGSKLCRETGLYAIWLEDDARHIFPGPQPWAAAFARDIFPASAPEPRAQKVLVQRHEYARLGKDR